MVVVLVGGEYPTLSGKLRLKGKRCGEWREMERFEWKVGWRLPLFVLLDLGFGGVVCEGSCQVLADGGRRAVGGLYSSWLAAVGYLLGAAWWGPSWDCGNCGIAMVEGPPKISQVKYGESSGNQAF